LNEERGDNKGLLYWGRIQIEWGNGRKAEFPTSRGSKLGGNYQDQQGGKGGEVKWKQSI